MNPTLELLREWKEKYTVHLNALQQQELETMGAIKAIDLMIQDIDTKIKENAVAERQGKKPKTPPKITKTK